VKQGGDKGGSQVPKDVIDSLVNLGFTEKRVLKALKNTVSYINDISNLG
jgi:hypothetical protein